MKIEIVKLAKSLLNMTLVSSDDLTKSEDIFDEIKGRNYEPNLCGFKPDLNQSVKNIADFIEESFNHYDEVVVFACDAISYEYYLSKIQSISKNYSHQVGVLSSVFPSTTSVVWPSVITGTFPSEHGIYGTSFLHENLNKNYIWISNTSNHKGERKVVDDKNLKLNLSGKKTVFEKLKCKNIVSYYLGSHGQGVFNPLRNELTKGSIYIKPGDQYSELKKDPQKLVNYFLDKNEELFKKNEGKRLIWNYIDFDDFIHENGYLLLSKLLDWNTIFNFWDKNEKNKLFLFISDHGQVQQEPFDFSILKASDSNPDLKYNAGGAGRVMYFYPEKGKEDTVYKWVKNIVGKDGIVFRKDELITDGLIEKNAVGLDRIGSIVAIATSPKFPSAGNKYKMEHGSISSEEMFIPLLIQAGSK